MDSWSQKPACTAGLAHRGLRLLGERGDRATASSAPAFELAPSCACAARRRFAASRADDRLPLQCDAPWCSSSSSAACAGDPPPPPPSTARTVLAPRPEVLAAGTGAMTPLAMRARPRGFRRHRAARPGGAEHRLRRRHRGGPRWRGRPRAGLAPAPARGVRRPRAGRPRPGRGGARRRRGRPGRRPLLGRPPPPLPRRAARAHRAPPRRGRVGQRRPGVGPPRPGRRAAPLRRQRPVPGAGPRRRDGARARHHAARGGRVLPRRAPPSPARRCASTASPPRPSRVDRGDLARGPHPGRRLPARSGATGSPRSSPWPPPSAAAR